MREKMGGNVTTFSSVSDGQRTLQSGDVLRLATKPVLVGRALHFVVGQVSARKPPDAPQSALAVCQWAGAHNNNGQVTSLCVLAWSTLYTVFPQPATESALSASSATGFCILC